jgi:protein-S-isoprenylcysteine O-methyltransferase
VLKRWAMGALGKEYHVHIVSSPGQRLVREGPYALVRHPTYLSRLIGTMGIALMMNAYWTLLAVGLLDLLAVSLRIHFEERELLQNFKEEYEDYRTATGALIPKFRKLLF